MEFMIRRREYRAVVAESPCRPLIFIVLRSLGIKLLPVIAVLHMQFIWSHSNDRTWSCQPSTQRLRQNILTIFLMQLLEVKGELASTDYLVIELVPSRQRCELWTRKVGDGMEVEAIACQADEIDNPNRRGDD